MENVINFDLLKEYDTYLKEVLCVWLKNKAYAVNDVVQYEGKWLKCTTAGTSGTTTLDFTGLDVGDTITDGTVVWEIFNPYGEGGATSSNLVDIDFNDLFKDNGYLGTVWNAYNNPVLTNDAISGTALDCIDGGILSTRPWTDIISRTGDFTIDFWAKIDSITGGDRQVTFCACVTGSNNSGFLLSVLASGNLRVGFRSADDSTWAEYSTVSAQNYIGTGYHNYVFMRRGTNALFKVDNVVIYTITDFPSILGLPVSGDGFTIGKPVVEGNSSIIIDNFKIY